MANNGLFDKIEKLLISYSENDKIHLIKTEDILTKLEFHLCEEISSENDIKKRIAVFVEYLFDNKKWQSTEFTSFSILKLVELYFRKQIEYHGLFMLAAHEMMNEEGFEDETGIFNSAKVSQIPTWDYYMNISNCKTEWENLSKDLSLEMENWCFPPPRKI